MDKLGKTPPSPALVRELERITEQLAGADNWGRRFSAFLNSLQGPKAPAAFKELVSLGCVPDTLVYCCEQQVDGQEYRESLGAKRAAYRCAMRGLKRQFEQLAHECNAYIDLVSIPSLAYELEPDLSEWLIREASRVQESIRAADARQRLYVSRGEATLVTTMQTIKSITGDFRDSLLARLISGMPGAPAMSAQSLKRWRSRELARIKRGEWRRPVRNVEDSYPKFVGRRMRNRGDVPK